MATDAGVKLIDSIVCNWAPEYRHSIIPEGPRPGGMSYRTVWSKPTNSSPIPDAVAMVHFIVRDKAGTSGPSGYDVTYVIENQRYVHNVEDKMKFQQVWLDRVLDSKRAANGILAH